MAVGEVGRTCIRVWQERSKEQEISKGSNASKRATATRVSKRAESSLRFGMDRERVLSGDRGGAHFYGVDGEHYGVLRDTGLSEGREREGSTTREKMGRELGEELELTRAPAIMFEPRPALRGRAS